MPGHDVILLSELRRPGLVHGGSASLARESDVPVFGRARAAPAETGRRTCEVLALAHLDRLFEICGSAEDALAGFTDRAEQ